MITDLLVRECRHTTFSDKRRRSEICKDTIQWYPPKMSNDRPLQ